MSNLSNKLGSRKFWMATAAALASIGASITGLATDNATIATTGLVCTMASAAIYAASEAYVDGQSAKSAQTINQIVTTKQVTATTSDKATVQAALAPSETKEAPNA